MDRLRVVAYVLEGGGLEEEQDPRDTPTRLPNRPDDLLGNHLLHRVLLVRSRVIRLVLRVVGRPWCTGRGRTAGT